MQETIRYLAPASKKPQFVKKQNEKEEFKLQTSQELGMLSSVTINCQVTQIVMNSGSQLSEL